MPQSYTDLAAQHAVARVETFRPLTPPPVPQGVPRFTSRGIAHPTKEAFPPYLQPEVTFIDGSDQVEMVLYVYKNYRRVLQNFTRQWTLMISNDTQSSAEDSISQSY